MKVRNYMLIEPKVRSIFDNPIMEVSEAELIFNAMGLFDYRSIPLGENTNLGDYIDDKKNYDCGFRNLDIVKTPHTKPIITRGLFIAQFKRIPLETRLNEIGRLMVRGHLLSIDQYLLDKPLEFDLSYRTSTQVPTRTLYPLNK